VTLPVFGFVSVHRRSLPDGVACEAESMASAAAGRAAAVLAPHHRPGGGA